MSPILLMQEIGQQNDYYYNTIICIQFRIYDDYTRSSGTFLILE
jgi:hypothetical protein